MMSRSALYAILSFLCCYTAVVEATCQHTFGDCAGGCYNENGQVLPNGIRICSPVGLGNYSPSGNNQQIQCPAGTFSGETEANQCESCEAGSISGRGRSSCLICPAGFYQQLPGQSTCKSCTAVFPGYTGSGSNSFVYDVPSETLYCALIGVEPSTMPSPTPSTTPTMMPSTDPSSIPSGKPSTMPSTTRSFAPSRVPTLAPSSTPSTVPTITPSRGPSVSPSLLPSATPSVVPSMTPSIIPSMMPSSRSLTASATVRNTVVFGGTIVLILIVVGACCWRCIHTRKHEQQLLPTAGVGGFVFAGEAVVVQAEGVVQQQDANAAKVADAKVNGDEKMTDGPQVAEIVRAAQEDDDELQVV